MGILQQLQQQQQQQRPRALGNWRLGMENGSNLLGFQSESNLHWEGKVAGNFFNKVLFEKIGFSAVIVPS